MLMIDNDDHPGGGGSAAADDDDASCTGCNVMHRKLHFLGLTIPPGFEN
jgi:hypothetical protein